MVKFMDENLIALSFDIEDWFTVRNMRNVINENEWDSQDQRIHIGLDFILDSLKKRNIKATFFVLGWVAERAPELIRKIDREGHEIGTHGYSHTPIDLMTSDEFKSDLLESIRLISNITSKKVKGFRAPSFSITNETLWALEIIKEAGLIYDSSIFSTVHPDYGIKNFPRQITKIDQLMEVPMKKGEMFGIKFPFCGGGYFRMLPYGIVKSSMKKTIKNESFVMYFHPWEFDPNQPRMNLPLFKKFRHYVGLNSNRNKFEKMLNDFQFTTIENLIAHEVSRNNIVSMNTLDVRLLN